MMLIDSPSKAPRLLPLEEEGPVEKAPRKRRLRFWRRSTDADVFRRAIEVIDERGWTTGAWLSPTGRVCLLGAIGVAAVESGRRPLGPRGVTLEAVMIASDKIVGADRLNLSSWNDNLPYSPFGSPTETCVNQVKRRLAKMAARAEKNGGKYVPRSFEI